MDPSEPAAASFVTLASALHDAAVRRIAARARDRVRRERGAIGTRSYPATCRFTLRDALS